MDGEQVSATRSSGDERRIAWRLAAFYGATFLVAGIKTTYFPVWLDGRGLTAAEIGIIASAPMLLRIIAAPAIGIAADASGDHRRMIIGLAWLALALTILLVGAGGFWPILVVVLALSTASTALIPLTETMAMASVKRAGADYGRMRLWGSLTFILAGFAAGVGVDRLGSEAALWLLIASGLITGAAAHALPRQQPIPTTASKQSDLTPRPPFRMADVGQLMASRPFLWLLLSVGSVQAAHAVFYIFGVLQWRQQGLSSVTASTLWMIGVVTEIALFAFSGAAVRAIGASGLVMIGALAGILRWTAMGTDPGLVALILLQSLHGLTYGATHLGALHLIAAIVPPDKAGTAQAFYSSATSGIAMALATLAAGALYPVHGGGAYFAMAALSAIGAIATLKLLSLDHR